MQQEMSNQDKIKIFMKAGLTDDDIQTMYEIGIL